MKPEMIDTIARHLKGIVAALEKEKVGPIHSYIDLGLIGNEYITIWILRNGSIYAIKTPLVDVEAAENGPIYRLHSEIKQMSEYVPREEVIAYIDRLSGTRSARQE